MNFFDRYEQVCRERGLEPCAQSTAELFGSTKSTISAWRTKNTYPKGETVAAIADALDVSADYLLCRTDDPTDYANGDLIASVAGPVLDEFDGDVRKAIEFQKAVAEDAAREYADRRNTTPSIIKLYEKLDEIDKAKAEAYITGLLAAEKYTINSEREYNLSLVAARSSNNEAIHIENLPDLKKVTSNDTDF